MATGDILGNLDRLKLELRATRYKQPLDLPGLRVGRPASLLPIFHFALLDYSRHVARYTSERGYELFAKSDLRFVDCVLKVLRDEYHYRSPLSTAQFLSQGFVERKLILAYDLLRLCKEKHTELLKAQKSPVRALKVCSSQLESYTRMRHHRATPPSPSRSKTASPQVSVARNLFKPSRTAYIEKPPEVPRLSPARQKGTAHLSPAYNKDEKTILAAATHYELDIQQTPLSLEDFELLCTAEAQGLEEGSRSPEPGPAGLDLSPETAALEALENSNKAAVDELTEKVQCLEEKYTALEEAAARSKEDLQAKVTILEARVRFLEALKAQKDLPKEPKQLPVSTSNDRNQAWTARPMRDTTNLQHPAIAPMAKPAAQVPAPKTNTSEFIANIKARFESTKELLAENQPGHSLAP